MARDTSGNRSDKPVVIKKYANRRLYNTATSSYVTLDHLCQMVKDEVDFVVYDAKTGEDITRSVLTQIIVEEEAKGTNLLPITFLRQLISFYGHSMQGVVPRYLEQMMAAFAQNQDRLRQQMQETMSGMFPFGTNLEEMGRQNAAFMESAMKMFAPFAGSGESGQAASGHAGPNAGNAGHGSGDTAPSDQSPEALAQLQEQVNRLQQQIDALTEERPSDESAASSGAAGERPGRERPTGERPDGGADGGPSR